MLGRTDSRRRLLVLLAALIVAAGSLLARLSWWQVVQHDGLAAAAAAQTSLRYDVPSRRGAIYDRSGTVLLATTVDRYLLAGAPQGLSQAQRDADVARLSALLGLAPADSQAMADGMATGRPYVVLARDLDEATSRTDPWPASRSRTSRSASTPRTAAAPAPRWPRRCWAS
jgi:cell division protein FtsI/penicillin-binding protein 2